MVNIKLNGNEYQVEEGKTILEAAKGFGIDIPHFCYHPGLSIAGNCRMCLVEVKGMPKLMTACSTPVSDGMEIETESDVVKEARKGVLEFILLDHPVDCPICDKSGECMLQDHYFDHSSEACRSPFPKERHRVMKVNEKIYKNDNRCVLCTRCIRFLEEVTETHELTTVDRGHGTYIVCTDPEKLDKNPFASNISDICPVGALGLNHDRFRKRVWFAEEQRGVCQKCEAGCNLSMLVQNQSVLKDSIGEPVSRFIAAPNESMGRHFICEEGRYSCKDYNLGDKRLMAPLYKNESISPEEAVETFRNGVAKAEKGIVILSPLVSVEENYALYLFAKKNSFKIYRAGAFKKDLPTPALFIEKTKAPNLKVFKYMDVPRITEEDTIDTDMVVMLHSLGKIHDKSEIKLLGLLKRAACSVVFEPAVSQFGENADMVLPVPLFFEVDGSFINVNDRVQVSRKAIAHPLSIRSGWDWHSEGEYTSAETLFVKFSEEYLEKKLTYSDLGEEGCEL